MQLDTAQQTPHNNTAHCDTFATSLCEENISFHTSSERTVFPTMQTLSKIIAKVHTNTVENIRSPFTIHILRNCNWQFLSSTRIALWLRGRSRLSTRNNINKYWILGRSLSTIFYLVGINMICNKLLYFSIEYLKVTAQFDLN